MDLRRALLTALLASPGLAEARTPPVDFALQPAALTKLCGDSLGQADARLKAIAASPADKLDFKGVVVGLETALADLADSIGAAKFLKDVAPDKALRDASLDCETKYEKFGVDVYAREDLFKAVEAAAKAAKLQGEDQRLLEKIELAFKRNGLLLPGKDRARVLELKKKLVELEQAFGQNINDFKDQLVVERGQLDGLSDDYISRLSTAPGGRYVVGLDYPEYFPFMENAKDEAARRALESKFDDRVSSANVKVLEEALGVRREIAKLLGYPTWADYVLEDRMAKTPEAVRSFLDRLRGRVRAKAEAELAVLRALKKKETGRDEPIMAWDVRYYRTALKKAKYSVDPEAIKEYFPTDSVVDKVLGVYQELLGVAFNETVPARAWHPDVRQFEVADASTGRRIGRFYLDIFPREGKYKHAAAFDIVDGRETPDGYQEPVMAMVANFNKPAPGRPSLLPHEEVETFFHEFGHLMHGVLTKSRYERFSGTNVAWDFVEAPSQMLENFAWDPAVLGRISGHYKDLSKKLPKETIERMLAARNFDSGMRYSRQVFYSILDQTYHGAEPVDTTSAYARLMPEISLLAMTPGTHPQASFGHLMGGYDAGYYGYVWSDVYAQDMFSRFQKAGVLSPRIGLEYRTRILEPGGGREEMDSLKDFLGREPSEDAFFRHIGLAAPDLR